MPSGVKYKTLVDIRPVGSEQLISDYYDIPAPPAAGILPYRIVEVPLNVPYPGSSDAISVRVVDPITHVYSSGQVFTAVYAPTLPVSGQFQIDNTNTFKYGTIKFNGLDGNQTVEIRLTGRGSIIYASDVQDPRDELTAARSTEADVNARFGHVEDGTRIQSGKILPRHISTTNTDDFVFPRKVTVNGDLDVKGTVTYLESSTLNIGDNIITLDAGVVGSPTLDAGFEINRGSSATASLLWRETGGQKWEFTQGGLLVSGGDLDLSHHKILQAAPQYAADQTAETTVAGTAIDGQLLYRTDLKALRIYNSTAGVFKTAGATLSRFDCVVGTPSSTYTGSTTVFDLPFSYNTGSNQLLVHVQGMLQTLGGGADYVESTSTRVTFNSAETIGQKVSFVNIGIAV